MLFALGCKQQALSEMSEQEWGGNTEATALFAQQPCKLPAPPRWVAGRTGTEQQPNRPSSTKHGATSFIKANGQKHIMSQSR